MAKMIFLVIWCQKMQFIRQKRNFLPKKFTFFIELPNASLRRGGEGTIPLIYMTKNLRSACYKMFGFIFCSMFTLLHYRIEPPTSYRWEVNLTIASEGFIAMLMAATTFYCRLQENVKENDQLTRKVTEGSLLKESSLLIRLANKRT